MRVRPAAVAGSFYPAAPGELRGLVDALLDRAEPVSLPGMPRALIVPHAGYVYSGPVAATGFRALAESGLRPRRIVLIGPAHYVPFPGLALSPAQAFATPLGLVPVDTGLCERLAALSQVAFAAQPHAPEHALEVELPFLQRLFADLAILPLLFGGTSDAETEEAIDRVWDEETLLLVSSDLSHYEPYERAKAHDRATAEAIERLDEEPIGPAEACGYRAIRALLRLARKRDLRPLRLDLRSSGDTAGDRSAVVGYGAWAFW